MRSTNITQFIAAMLIALTTIVLADESRSSGLPIAFTLETPGRVSVALYDNDGVEVRTLRNVEPLATGAHTVYWDGLGNEGRAVPQREYTWKLLQSQGLQAEYLMAVGTSTGLNHGPGQHNGPISVACDGGVRR